MDASTRPPQKRHRASLHLAASLVAVYFGVIPAALGAINSQTDPLPAIKPLIVAPTAHDIGITTVKSGEEGLELSARFSEDGAYRVGDIDWRVRNRFGAEVFHGIATTVDAVLPPDDYQIEAEYGTAHILQSATVHEGTKLSVSFILNAGALRILPRVTGIDHMQSPSHSMIYANAGPLKGQLIATSYTPGEIIKLSAGVYRIESRFDLGNAIAISDVEVKPGKMSAVHVDHLAGLAKLNVKNSPSGDVHWTITDQTGIVLPTPVGPSYELVLKSGHYTVEVSISGQKHRTTFDVKAGKTSEVTINN